MDHSRGEIRQRDPEAKMTLRVYTVDRAGTVTTDTGVHGYTGPEHLDDALTATSQFPACACPRCRAARARR